MINLLSINYIKKEFILEIPISCLKIIDSAIELVNRKITYGFHARLGYSPEETLVFKEKILGEIHQNINEKNSRAFEVKEIHFNYDELAIVNQCLNEICNGLKVDNFEDTIGVSKDFAISLLAEVNLIICQFQFKVGEYSSK